MTEEQEAWALDNGFDEVVVKTKNKLYGMRATLAHLQFNVIKYEPSPQDNRESKVYLSKRLGLEVLDRHRSRRFVIRSADSEGRELTSSWAELGVPEAAHEMVVHHPGGLHEGVADRRSDELEASGF